MRERFDILDFCVDNDGFLHSPKAFSDEWDFQTKALYYRSINIGPNRIAKMLKLNVNTLKNREFLGLITLKYEGKNYELRETSWCDWSTIGSINCDLRYYENHGGASMKPELEAGQRVMDGELAQCKRDYYRSLNRSKNSKLSNPSDDLYKKYYEDYEG